MTTKRHPIRGLFAGLFLGIGVALLLFALGVIPFTVPMLGVITVVGVAVGVALAYVAPVRPADGPSTVG